METMLEFLERIVAGPPARAWVVVVSADDRDRAAEWLIARGGVAGKRAARVRIGETVVRLSSTNFGGLRLVGTSAEETWVHPDVSVRCLYEIKKRTTYRTIVGKL